MTKEERAASRAICDAATKEPWEVHCDESTDHTYIVKNGCHCGICAVSCWDRNGGNDSAFIAHARTALPAALNALDEMEEQVDRMSCVIAQQKVLLNQKGAARTIDDICADRDHWKARAEALERAIKNSSICCFLCIHDFASLEQEPCKSCKKKANWEFDQERFR